MLNHVIEDSKDFGKAPFSKLSLKGVHQNGDFGNYNGNVSGDPTMNGWLDDAASIFGVTTAAKKAELDAAASEEKALKLKENIGYMLSIGVAVMILYYLYKRANK